MVDARVVLVDVRPPQCNPLNIERGSHQSHDDGKARVVHSTTSLFNFFHGARRMSTTRFGIGCRLTTPGRAGIFLELEALQPEDWLLSIHHPTLDDPGYCGKLLMGRIPGGVY